MVALVKNKRDKNKARNGGNGEKTQPPTEQQTIGRNKRPYGFANAVKTV